MNSAKDFPIFVYDTQGSLINNFSSVNKTTKFFNCSPVTILKYIKNKKLFKKEGILSTNVSSPITFIDT
jgi:hypothetical protein